MSGDPAWQEWDGENDDEEIEILAWTYGAVPITEDNVLSALKYARRLGYDARRVELHYAPVVFPDADDIPAIADDLTRDQGLDECEATLIVSA